MKTHGTTLLFLTLICNISLSQELSDTNHLSIIFCGDIMGHDSQIKASYNVNTNTYNYDTSFSLVADYISQADIAIGNLEVTLAGQPYKGYPQFSSPDDLAWALKRAGFDILVTANNHGLDRGTQGLVRTIEVLDSLEFLRAGTYRDTAERYTMHPLIFEKNNIRIALLNYTYGTNGLVVKPPYIINRIDTAMIAYEIRKARKAMADFIVVFIHWGNEYERNENAVQKKLANFIFMKGADAIIGSHPHVVQPVKSIYLPGDPLTSYPVVYSLGNFISNQRERYTDGGIIAGLYLTKIDSITVLDSLDYMPYGVWRDDQPTGSTFHILPVSRYEADTMIHSKMKQADIDRLKTFATDVRKHLEGVKESRFYRRKEE